VDAVAILPIKRFESAKSRLGATAERASLAASMAERVLDALSAATRLDAVLVVTADASARTAAEAHGFEVVAEPVLAGHNAAAQLGIARALALGAKRALLVPGDCPLLSGDEVDGLLERHPGEGVVVVPDRHGTGTNALLLSPPDAIAPAFGPGSRDRHLKLAPGAVLDEVPGLLLDVDTPDDLAAVQRVSA
jgi:2-phospho-L-lactate/phosphoenolpyruvate guanylyltransferase